METTHTQYTKEFQSFKPFIFSCHISYLSLHSLHLTAQNPEQKEIKRSISCVKMILHLGKMRYFY